jgi:hypothetical protein
MTTKYDSKQRTSYHRYVELRLPQLVCGETTWDGKTVSNTFVFSVDYILMEMLQ